MPVTPSSDEKILRESRLAWLVPVAALACLLIATAGASRALAQCHPDTGCGGCKDRAERLKCKFDAFAEEGKKTIDRLQQPPYVDHLTAAQREGLKRSKDRLEREKARTTPDDFKLLAKKKGGGCQLVEKTGDGDGVCQPSKGETCAEVVGDGIGDDDGICSPLNGSKREACVQICDQEAVMEGEMDDNASAELEDTYDDLTGRLKEVNESLPDASLVASPLRMAILQSDACVLDTTLVRTSGANFRAAKWASMGTRAAADVAERFCDQTFTSLFFTWTLGAVCVAAETGVLGVNEWLNIIEISEAAIDAEALDKTLQCARQTAGSSGDLTELIQAAQNKVNDLKAKQAEINRLLGLPPGSREGYPKP
jgi:hypothetical protein